MWEEEESGKEMSGLWLIADQDIKSDGENAVLDVTSTSGSLQEVKKHIRRSLGGTYFLQSFQLHWSEMSAERQAPLRHESPNLRRGEYRLETPAS